jgi:hypothetical protein
MAKSFEELKDEALSLPLKERALLAENLIHSLDAMDEAELECLWVEEAGRRYQEFKDGNIPARPAHEVLRNARSCLS